MTPDLDRAVRTQAWKYVEPGDDGITPVEYVVTEAEILRTYYPWWRSEMERQGKHALITEQSCIDDWVVVHWAARV